MAIRDFKGAALLFLESVPTFGSYELISYEDLVIYTIITAMYGKHALKHLLKLKYFEFF